MLELTKQIRDLERRFGLEVALKTEAAFRELRHSLAEDPWCGHVREELAPLRSGLRFLTVRKLLVVVHRVDQEEVVVLHVYDGRRDLKGLLRNNRGR